LVFGSVQVGSSKSQSAILTNTGSAALTISQASVSGGAYKATGFAVPIKLNPGESTAFTVVFTPTAAGTSSGNVSLSSDASNSTLAITLAGTATSAPTPGALNSSLSAVTFGNVEVGNTKTQSEVLTNTGETAVTVSQASVTGAGFSLAGLSLPATLNAGQSVSFNVTYAPGAEGVNTGTINVVSNASNPTLGIALAGTGTAATSPAVLAQSVSTLAFGNVQVGTSKSETETLTNTGTTPITISQANVSGSGYSISGLTLPLKLAAGQSANFSVTYSPTSAGLSSGSLVISSDASNSTLAASLSATATAAPKPGTLSVSASSISFGSILVGEAKRQSETLKNTGESLVTISQANLSGVGFSLEGLYLPLQLNAGESFTFNLVFAPGAAATASGALFVVSDASNTLSPVALTGTGAPTGKLLVTPTALNFGSVTVGGSKSLTTTLSAQASSVTISSGEISGSEFTLSGVSFPLTLSAGQSVPVTFTFTPQSSGSASGNLALSTNTSTATVMQTLSGSATAAPHHSVSLSWDGSSAGFLVYRGTQSGGPYARITSTATAASSYVDSAVQSGATYYYVTTSVDSSGEESDYSNEVKAVVPSP
jgi:hypothetical protein